MQEFHSGPASTRKSRTATRYVNSIPDRASSRRTRGRSEILNVIPFPARPDPSFEEDYDDGDPYSCIAAGVAGVTSKLAELTVKVEQCYGQPAENLQALVEEDRKSTISALWEIWYKYRFIFPARSPQHANWAAEQAALLDYSALVEYDRRPPEIQWVDRVVSLETTCRDPDDLANQCEFLLELEKTSRTEASRLRKELLTVLRKEAISSLFDRRWECGEQQLQTLANLGEETSVGLRIVLLWLSGQRTEAKSVWVQQMEKVLSPVLELVLGFSQDTQSNSVAVDFARFERAYADNDESTAQSLAESLEKASDTPFLLLWLGWYHYSNSRYTTSAGLWARAVKAVSDEHRHAWRVRLWSKLRGKVPFWVQVRWGALQGVEKFLDGSRPKSQECSIIGWAEEVWTHRIGGRAAAGNELFLTRFLEAQIDTVGPGLFTPTAQGNELRLPAS